MKSRWQRNAGVFVGVGLLASAVWAQSTYRCINSAGVAQWQDRPCNSAPAPELGVRAAPPAPPVYRQRSYGDALPTPQPASEHVKYLSPGCAEIQEAIRTGPSRGVRYDTLSQLRLEYDKKCRDEDMEARRRARDDDQAQRESKQAQKLAQQQAKTQAQEEADRCRELLRLLNGRRARVATMNEGEKADLKRFEDNYTQRCAAR